MMVVIHDETPARFEKRKEMPILADYFMSVTVPPTGLRYIFAV